MNRNEAKGVSVYSEVVKSEIVLYTETEPPVGSLKVNTEQSPFTFSVTMEDGGMLAC